MSVKKITEVWDCAHGLSGNDLLAMLALADWSNEDGLCWPKMESIAAKVRVDVDTARKIIKRLEGQGYLVVERVQGRGRNNSFWIYPRGNAPQKIEEKQEDKTPEQKPPFNKPLSENPLFSTAKTPEQKPPFLDGAYKDDPSVLNRQEPSLLPGDVAPDEKPPPKKSKKSDSIPATHPVRLALVAACRIDTDSPLTTRGTFVQLAETTKAFVAAGTPPDQINRAAESWFAHDWRGQRGDPPTPAQFREHFLKFTKGPSNHGTHQRQPEQRTRSEKRAAAWDAWVNDIATDFAEAEHLRNGGR